MKFSSRGLLSLGMAIGVATALSATPGIAADKVMMGMLRAANVAFVAKDKGFFADEGIDFQHTFFPLRRGAGALAVDRTNRHRHDLARRRALQRDGAGGERHDRRRL